MRKLSFGMLLTVVSTTSCVHHSNPTCQQDEIVNEQYFHEYGVAVPKFHWEESGQNGQVIKNLKQGIVCSQSYYCGRLEGETTYTFPHSELIEKIEVYSQDQLKKQTIFYMSGRPKKEIIYNPSEHNIITEWYESGQLKSCEKFAGDLIAHAEYYDPQGHRQAGVVEGTGQKINFDQLGLHVDTDSFKNGQVEYRTTYYPNGAPKEITPYVNGVVEGVRKTYYQGGEPNTIESWISGKQEGITTIFSEGQKAKEVNYVNGQKNGPGRIYQDGAIVIADQMWKDDRLHGPCHTLIDNRKVTEWYYKGNKVSKGYYDSFTQFTPMN